MVEFPQTVPNHSRMGRHAALLSRGDYHRRGALPRCGMVSLSLSTSLDGNTYFHHLTGDSSNSQDLWIGLPLAGVSLLVLGGTSRLAGHAVGEVDHSRIEGTGLDEFEVHPVLALGKEGTATAHQHRQDPDPILVDETQRGRLGGERRAADRDVALRRFGSQTLDLLL